MVSVTSVNTVPTHFLSVTTKSPVSENTCKGKKTVVVSLVPEAGSPKFQRIESTFTVSVEKTIRFPSHESLIINVSNCAFAPKLKRRKKNGIRRRFILSKSICKNRIEIAVNNWLFSAKIKLCLIDHSIGLILRPSSPISSCNHPISSGFQHVEKKALDFA